eukprot:scaffold5866_cov93-Isochrysis_galbana.AAC.4
MWQRPREKRRLPRSSASKSGNTRCWAMRPWVRMGSRQSCAPPAPPDALRLRTTTTYFCRPSDGATHRTSIVTLPPAGITPALGCRVSAARDAPPTRRRDVPSAAGATAVPSQVPTTPPPPAAAWAAEGAPDGPLPSLRMAECVSSFRSITTNCTSAAPALRMRKRRQGGAPLPAGGPSKIASATPRPSSEMRTSPKSISGGSNRRQEASAAVCRQSKCTRREAAADGGRDDAPPPIVGAVAEAATSARVPGGRTNASSVARPTGTIPAGGAAVNSGGAGARQGSGEPVREGPPAAPCTAEGGDRA